jgi:hypothetical protein
MRGLDVWPTASTPHSKKITFVSLNEAIITPQNTKVFSWLNTVEEIVDQYPIDAVVGVVAGGCVDF